MLIFIGPTGEFFIQAPDDIVHRAMDQFLADVRLLELEAVLEDREIARVIAQPAEKLLSLLAESLQGVLAQNPWGNPGTSQRIREITAELETLWADLRRARAARGSAAPACPPGPTSLARRSCRR